MKRIEFITELSRRLYKLPEEELESVLSYYDEIFLDAGIEHEEETAENWVILMILSDKFLWRNNIDPDGSPEYYVDSAKQESNNYQQEAEEQSFNREHGNGMSAGAKMLIAVLTFPIWLPILIVIVSLAFALVVTVISVAFAFAVAGIACIGVGIVTLFSYTFGIGNAGYRLAIFV